MKNLILIITVLLLVGCTPVLEVDGNAVMVAGQKCEINGGVDTFRLYPSEQEVKAICKNGATFTNTISELLNGE